MRVYWFIGLLVIGLLGCSSFATVETEMFDVITPTTVAATETAVSPTDPAPTNTPLPEPTAQPEAEPTTAPTSGSGDADVLHVRALATGDDTWTFHVTVEHLDTGWEDYADGWDVVLPDGTAVLPNPDSPFTRLLLHPHENEQPFTRSQSNIVIPADITTVTVRAHDLVDGFGGQEVVVDLTEASGDNFEVER
ncbi:MAG: hypothetical protein AAF614_35335 [Chloroflexota bacterium]